MATRRQPCRNELAGDEKAKAAGTAGDQCRAVAQVQQLPLAPGGQKRQADTRRAQPDNEACGLSH